MAPANRLPWWMLALPIVLLALLGVGTAINMGIFRDLGRLVPMLAVFSITGGLISASSAYAIHRYLPYPRMSLVAPAWLTAPMASRSQIQAYSPATIRTWADRAMEVLQRQEQVLLVLWGEDGLGADLVAAEVTQRLARKPLSRMVLWVSMNSRPGYDFNALLDHIGQALGSPDIGPKLGAPKVAAAIAAIRGRPLAVIVDGLDDRPDAGAIVRSLRTLPLPVLVLRQHPPSTGPGLHIERPSESEIQTFIASLPGGAELSRTERSRLAQIAEYNPLALRWLVGAGRLSSAAVETLSREATTRRGKVLEWALARLWNELTAEERQVLLALTLFAHGAQPDSLGAVCSLAQDLIRRAGQQVVALNLAETSPTGDLAVGSLVRRLVQQQHGLDEEMTGLRRRFATYWLNFAHNQDPPGDLLAANVPNLLAALDQAIAVGMASLALDLTAAVGACGGILQQLNCWGEIRYRQLQAAAIARANGQPEAEVGFIHTAALSALSQGDVEDARRLLEQENQLQEQLGNRQGVIYCLNSLASIASDEGQWTVAQRFFEQSLQISREIADRRTEASTLHQLGLLAQQQGDLETARSLYGQSIQLEKELGDREGEAITMAQVGLLEETKGYPVMALSLMRQAEAVFEELQSAIVQQARRHRERLEKLVSRGSS